MVGAAQPKRASLKETARRLMPLEKGTIPDSPEELRPDL